MQYVMVNISNMQPQKDNMLFSQDSLRVDIQELLIILAMQLKMSK